MFFREGFDFLSLWKDRDNKTYLCVFVDDEHVSMRGRWLHFLLYVQIYSWFFKNLLAASKVRVRGWYGAAWDELCVNWGRLHPAAVLGAFGGGGEALARATLHSLERRQLQLPPRRAGFARQRQVLRGVLQTRFGDVLVELSYTREAQLIV